LLQGSPSSRSEDADGDGISNFTEYLAGSDPKSRSSLVTASKSGDEVTLSFQQPANRAFLIDQSWAVPGQNWTMLSNAQNHMTFPVQNTPRTFTQMIDTNAPLQTFRLRIFEP
jgi:hypothetical protein